MMQVFLLSFGGDEERVGFDGFEVVDALIHVGDDTD